MPSKMLSGFRNIGNSLSSMWFGRTMYPTYSPETDRQRPVHVDMARDIAEVLPQARFLQAISDVRWLSISSDVVGGALRQKTDYISASRFATHFEGKDTAWGEEAEEKCAQLDAYCCTRGERYDWKRMWGLTIPYRATDGGVFFNLTETESGWPLVQPIEAPRVGCRNGDYIVKSQSARSYMRDDEGNLTEISTPYAGLKIVSGFIYDESGREVAYRVLGGADDGSEDVDVSAQDMIFIGTPNWFSEGRPMPQIAVSSLALQDISLARQAQLTKHLHSARLIALRENETGTPSQQRMADPLATRQRTPHGTGTSLVEEGQLSYFKMGKEKMTPWDTKTPGGEWMNFDDKTIASALHGMRWRVEMADPKQSGTGANTRAFADQINTLIMEEFDCLVPSILRVRRWQIAKLIKRGDLPSSDDWWKWGVTPPPEFSPDPGRAITSELEAVRAGAQSMPHVHRRWGQRPSAVLYEQADYLLLKRKIAQEKGLTPEETVQLGTLAQPGDAPIATPDASTKESEKRLADIQEAKAQSDAFGVSVRAGAVTPSQEDEVFMRSKLGLPPMSAAVQAAWTEESTRRPITLAVEDGATPAAPQPIEE